MSLSENGLSPADVVALNGSNGNDGMFGGNGAYWLIILFLFAFCGWGGNGFGGFGGGSGAGASDNYVLASDFATIQRQLSDGFGALEAKGDSISNGLCSGFYETARIGDGIKEKIYSTRDADYSYGAQGYYCEQ